MRYSQHFPKFGEVYRSTGRTDVILMVIGEVLDPETPSEFHDYVCLYIDKDGAQGETITYALFTEQWERVDD
jgi:hypothetical protein